MPVLPFLASAPATFIRSTITDQAVRTGSPISMGVRLANATGLIDIMNTQGGLTLNAGAHSLYAAGALANLGSSRGLGPAPDLTVVILVALVAAGYLIRATRLSELEWLSIATAVVAMGAILGYSSFFYHSPDFPAPWLALTVGGAAGALADYRAWRKFAVWAFVLLLACVTALQVRETFPLRQTTAEGMAHKIPAGACLVTDQASLAIAADRFANPPPGCPDIVDALAATLVLTNGKSIQGGAASMPQLVDAWRSWLSKADYLWLSPQGASWRRIPWSVLLPWFHEHFSRVGAPNAGRGTLYVRTHR